MLKHLYTDYEKYAFRKGSVPRILYKWLMDANFAAVFRWRLSIWLHRRGRAGRFLARWVWKRNCQLSACQLSPEVELGEGIYLPHATGIVIGHGTVIGRNVRILHHVTLGRRSTKDARCPVIEDGVMIFTQSSVLGAITLGTGAVVGAHSLVMKDVPAGAVVAGIPAKIITAN